jgi:hypothetical protein
LTQTIGLLFVKRQEDLKNCFEQLQLLDDQEKQATTDQGEGLDAAASEGGDDAAASKPLPESFREQLVALDRDFQEGQDGIVGLKSLIDAQLVSNRVKSEKKGCTFMWMAEARVYK